MTDTPRWPLTSNVDDITAFRDEWTPSDPLHYPELPPLVFPRPLQDKALTDDEEMRQ